MIKFEEIVPMLEETNIPVVTYGDIVDDDEYDLPLIVWNYTEDEMLSADGIPYMTTHNVSMTVLTEEKTLQEDVKNVLIAHEVFFSYNTDFDADNHTYVGVYNFQTL